LATLSAVQSPVRTLSNNKATILYGSSNVVQRISNIKLNIKSLQTRAQQETQSQHKNIRQYTAAILLNVSHVSCHMCNRSNCSCSRLSITFMTLSTLTHALRVNRPHRPLLHVLNFSSERVEAPPSSHFLLHSILPATFKSNISPMYSVTQS